MTDRAVLAIEINDDDFKAFQAKFAAYQKAVSDMPAQWDAVNKATGASRPIFEKMNELVDHQNDLVGDLADNAKRGEKPTQNVAASWGVIYRTGRLWSSSIKSSTLSLAKWSGLTAVFSGILSAGGLYGIDKMAAGVSGRRTGALGYGTTIGAQSSFQTNFGRIGNAEGILGSTSRALSDPRSRVFRSLGVSGKIEGMDAPHAFAAILPDIERLLKRTPENQLNSIIQGYGLGEIGLGLNEARFIRNAPTGETAKMINGFASDEGAMGVANPEAWSRFSTQMELAGGAIRVAFERNLASMTLPLGHITSSFETLFTALLKKGGMADDLIKMVGDGVDKFAKMIGSKSVVSAVDEFISRFDMTTKQFDVFNDWLGNHLPEVKIILAAAAGYWIGGPWGAAIGGAIGAAGVVAFAWNGPDTPYERDRIGWSGATPRAWGGGSSPYTSGRGETPYAPDRADSGRSSTPYQHRPHAGPIPMPWTTPEHGGTSPSVHGSRATGASEPVGYVAPGLREFEQDTLDIPGGRKRISSENDSFHHRVNPSSAHTKGLAFDQTLVDARRSEEAVAYERDRLHAAGLSDRDFTILDEYKHPSPHATGGHIHTQFNSPAAANKYREFSIKNHPNNSLRQSATPVDIVNNTGGASHVSVSH